jgi:hypothetical protein
MTLSELGFSSNSVSLASLADVDTLTGVRGLLTYKDLAQAATKGGWPALVGQDARDAEDYNISYIEDLCLSDVPTAIGVHRDPGRLRRLMASPEYFGQVFEAMAIHDLRVYAEAQRGRLYHYRDETGLGVDAIIEYPGTWAAAEVKLGASQIAKAETNLLKLRDGRVDTQVLGTGFQHLFGRQFPHLGGGSELLACGRLTYALLQLDGASKKIGQERDVKTSPSS